MVTASMRQPSVHRVPREITPRASIKRGARTRILSDRPTLEEIDAYFRNPSSLDPARQELIAKIVGHECVDGGARGRYLARRKLIAEAVAAEAAR